MDNRALEEWGRAEKEAMAVEDQVRQLKRGTYGRDQMLASATALRARADRLWSAYVGSTQGPSMPRAVPKPSAISLQAAREALKPMVEEWRLAQARAHAAEVRVVHAYSRFLEGQESEAPIGWQAEAEAVRHRAAERLQRIFDMVLDAKGASAP